MSTEKMSTEFEVWRSTQIASLIRTGHVQAARAFRDLGSIHWTAWQSAWALSRASIEVKLPSLRAITMGRRENEHDSGFNAGVELCIDAIESLSLKVKS